MTENKRYKCHVGVVGVHIGVGTDEHELTGDECRDLLNKLIKENEQLSEQLVDWETSFDICKAEKDELLEENKRLKLELETFKAGNQTLKATLDEVKNG